MERRLFETGVGPSRAPRILTLPTSLAIHAAVVTAALVIPLLSGHDLPEVAAASQNVFFVQPVMAPPPPPPPPPPPAGNKRVVGPPPTQQPSGMIAPRDIPDMLPEQIAEAIGAIGGSPDGVEGGVFEGVAGPIVAGLPPVAAVTQAPVRPGGDVREPRKLRDVMPVYSKLAIDARIQGDVVLDCVISTQGRVTDITVISGPSLLVEAAREAARQWLYTPTLLNGVPVPVLLRATVRFHLR
jgi:protein TonB